MRVGGGHRYSRHPKKNFPITPDSFTHKPTLLFPRLFSTCFSKLRKKYGRTNKAAPPVYTPTSGGHLKNTRKEKKSVQFVEPHDIHMSPKHAGLHKIKGTFHKYAKETVRKKNPSPIFFILLSNEYVLESPLSLSQATSNSLYERLANKPSPSTHA